MLPLSAFVSAALLLVAVLAAAWWLSRGGLFSKEPPPSSLAATSKEGYGPPPGRWPALDISCLDDRGWPQRSPVYQANSASSVSHMALRSA